jgi:hypothetical protein
MPKASTDSEDDKMKEQGIKSEIRYLLHSEGISACGVAAVKKLPPRSEVLPKSC